MGFFDRFKKTNKILEPDKHTQEITYIGVSKSEFINTTDLKELEKKVEKNVANQIRKAQKMNLNDLKIMYADVLDTKHSFVENVNVWSRTGLFDQKMDIVDHGYKQLRDELQKEIKKQS